MAGLARRLAPAAALGGLALIVVGVADPALAGRTDATATGVEAQGTSVTQSDTSTDTATDAPADTTADAPADTTTDAPADAAATCDTGEEVTGPSITTRWGPVQVAATIADGQLCDVHAVVWPDGDRKSSEISAYVIPILDEQASLYGTEFDGISGATYTSEGYRESLQQLLDSL